MLTLNPITIYIVNSILITDWINEGIIITTDCSQVSTNIYNGEVVLKNYTQMGERYLTISLPIVNILTHNNVTID